MANLSQPPPPPAGAERRATPRIPLRVGVRFKTTEELAKAVRATTKDVGLGGLCLLTKRSYETGAPLSLSIEVAGTEPLQVEAVVAWARPGQAIGVRFVSVSAEQERKLVELLGRAKKK